MFWICSFIFFINGKSRKCLVKLICLKIQIRLYKKSDTICEEFWNWFASHSPPWSKLPIFVLKLWDIFDSKVTNGILIKLPIFILFLAESELQFNYSGPDFLILGFLLIKKTKITYNFWNKYIKFAFLSLCRCRRSKE